MVLAECRINLVVAHPAEAKPLCAIFNLRTQVLRTPFPVYQNSIGINLIVSGMGKTAAATATAYLAGMQAHSPACAWLNIGIAGHQHAAIGAGLLAHKITDAASGGNFYPPQLMQGFSTTAVISVDQPERCYPEAAAYDMEASGFYGCASRMITSELVQVFKIISDNPEHPVERFDIAQVQSLIAGQQINLERLIVDCGNLLARYREAYFTSPAYISMLSQYRLTASQRVQLQRLCERFHALGLERELLEFSNRLFPTRKKLLVELDQHLTQWLNA